MDPASCAPSSGISSLLSSVSASQRQLGDLGLGGPGGVSGFRKQAGRGMGIDALLHRPPPPAQHAHQHDPITRGDVNQFIENMEREKKQHRGPVPVPVPVPVPGPVPHHPMLHHPPPFAGPGPGAMLQRPMIPPPSADSLVNEFTQMNMHEQFERMYAAPHVAHPTHALPLHPHPHPQAALAMGGPSPGWAAEFEQRNRMHFFHQMNAGPHFGTQRIAQPSSLSGHWVDEYDDVQQFQQQQQQQDNKHQENTFEQAFQQPATPQVQGEGWANEFAQEQAAASASGMGMGMDKDTIDQLMNSNDPKWRNSKFLKFIKQISSGEVELRDNRVIPVEKPAAQDWAAEFAANDAKAQQAMQQQVMPQGVDWASEFAAGVDDDAWAADVDGKQGDWASEFGQQQMFPGEAWAQEFMNEQRLQGEPYTQMDWVKAMEEAKNGVSPQRDPEYKFAADNPYLQSPNPYEEGIRLLENGKLKQAILAFEAEVQRNPENAEAWRYLGQAQAENEAETPAIAALLKAVHHDPYNLKALMMLGVSYTNDLEEKRALNYLKTWITNHPDYQQASMAQHKAALEEYESLYSDPHHSSPFDANLHQEVSKLFINAVQINPRDPELHTVLGVLYHISNDFDKSIEEFKQALKLRPDDPQLWNKLGATQANSSRSAEAVHAYKRALQLRPTYVRASANLAISYANQGFHEEAVRMYLSTLSQNPDAAHIWAYLRISLSHLNKDDLVELTQQHNPELFRPYYNF